MKYRKVLIACALAFVPTALFGQAARASASCVDADTALGVLTVSQQKAKLERTDNSGGTRIWTGWPKSGDSAPRFTVSWRGADIADPVAPQFLISIPTEKFDRLAAAGANMVLRVDDWLDLPLGLPTPPTILSAMRPHDMVLTVGLTEEDLRSLAGAKTATLRYGDSTFSFDQMGLATINVVYRAVRCARAAARAN